MFSISFQGNTEFNILYFNDVHAKTQYLSNFKTAVDTFDKQNKGKRTLKLSGGDLNLSTCLKTNKFIIKYMNKIGLDATSMGNHDLEGGDYWVQAAKEEKPNFKILTANLKFTKSNRANKLKGKIAKSAIVTRKGEKVGLIGLSPLDYGDLTLNAPFNNYIKVKNFNKTVEAVKQEVKALEKKGINKIFLLAHTGKSSKQGTEYYENLAKIGGIDVIIGGHDHKEYNLWYESNRKDKSGTPEPVKVVSVGQADDKNIKGQDLDSFGILKTVFNDAGVLIKNKCKNKVKLTESYPADQSIINLEEKYLQTNKVISTSNKDFVSKNPATEENPVANLAADAMLWSVNKDIKNIKEKAQIAIINSNDLRGEIYKGKVTVGQIRQALPFVASSLIKTTLTKKQIMDTLNWCVKSTTFPKVTPGLMQVGGMQYTIDSDNKVKNVRLINKDGTPGEKLDEQPDNKPYRVVYDIFLMSGIDGLSELKKDENDPTVQYIPFNRQKAVIHYLREKFPYKENSKSKPIEIETGRITKEKQPAFCVAV